LADDLAGYGDRVANVSVRKLSTRVGGGIPSVNKSGLIIRGERSAAVTDPVTAKPAKHRIGAQLRINVGVASNG
jgi:hypothetical protein